MTSSNLKYATIIPLIGGMTTGNKQAVGTDPVAFISYPAFSGNDSHARLNFPDVPFYMAESAEADALTGLDFISTVCPCAGLSSLNSGNRGSNAPQNEWMYRSAEYVLSTLKPRVFWGENAPALSTKLGEPVAKRLAEIGTRYGYAFSMVRTDTRLHGIPQKRIRTFYFFWKAEHAPMLGLIQRDSDNLLKYLSQIPADATYQEDTRATEYAANGYIAWFRSKPEYLQHWREDPYLKTVSKFVRTHNKWDELLAFLRENHFDSAVKRVEHSLEKIGKGLNYWDNTPQLWYGREYACSIQGRIFEHSIHPNCLRYVNLREHMHLMGLPHDYRLSDIKLAGHICQNVPVCTAKDWTTEVMRFLDGKLASSGQSFLVQNNMAEQVKTNTLSAHF